MGAPDGEQFVARERELASLRTALDRGLAGDPGLVLVVGEAGMGKTVLVDRLAALEDLHWADDASRWVLERLPHELAGRSVAIVPSWWNAIGA